MSENRTHLVDVPLVGEQGLLWNRLHEEREEVAEALVRCSQSDSRLDVLETRLQKIDRALDQMLNGSYGLCSKCRYSIEESTLDVDPAWTLCLKCWSEGAYSPAQEGEVSTIDFDTLDAFDTIILQTLNSEYRLFLLDPKAGRALVEGGSYLAQPCESFLVGTICVGGRLKMWIDDKMLSTSPIQSFQIKQNTLSEETVH